MTGNGSKWPISNMAARYSTNFVMYQFGYNYNDINGFSRGLEDAEFKFDHFKSVT